MTATSGQEQGSLTESRGQSQGGGGGAGERVFQSLYGGLAFPPILSSNGRIESCFGMQPNQQPCDGMCTEAGTIEVQVLSDEMNTWIVENPDQSCEEW